MKNKILQKIVEQTKRDLKKRNKKITIKKNKKTSFW